jgi:Tol biopolymer transport system component
MRSLLLVTVTLLAACGGGSPTPNVPTSGKPLKRDPSVDEVHFASVKQLTFGGENAEAYWSWGGDQLMMQASPAGVSCDRIYRFKTSDAKNMTQVSNGKGVTTCSYFLPGDQEVIYASTQLGGDACPPKPDHSQGYVWPIYETYDIYRARADGSGISRITDTPGYDAEGTVCKLDGSIVFTSVRDGDLELYRMDSDGKNVKRLTNHPGYDGGAFFSEDCTKLVWRAANPKGQELEKYKALLAKHLVYPGKLEIWVGNADGSEATQITHLDAASFAPYFFPGSKRVIFSSNYGDPKGREFDLWAVNVDGTALERITYTPGFDGFPIFSPDGKWLAFSSNRATAEGKHDTNVFLAQWKDVPPRTIPTAADRIAQDDAWLASPERDGRGVGTVGLGKAGEFIERRFMELGIEPIGKSLRQPFDVPTALNGSVKIEISGKELAGTSPLAFSLAQATVDAPLVLAGYGVQAEGWDDYKGLEIKDKIVVVRRFVPEAPAFETSEAKRKHGDLRHKAWLAREKGAKGLIVVDLPLKPAKPPADWKMPDEAKPPMLFPESNDVGLVAATASREAFAPIIARLEKKETIRAKLESHLITQSSQAFNVVGRWSAHVPNDQRLPGAIVIGAHYDHLGMGGHGSLAPDAQAVHPGADDNASGVSTLLEIARALAGGKVALRRDVVFIAFSGEERGVLGSSFFVKNPPAGVGPNDILAMINMDMVGRVRGNQLDVIGHDTADEWPGMITPACEAVKIDCALAKGGGYGPSDHSPFYGAGIPVLHLFSGPHADYHKPSDTADKLNADGAAQVAKLVTELAKSVTGVTKMTVKQIASPPPAGDLRSFGASLGTVPDYAGPPNGKSGMLLAGVRPGGAADQAGMKRGDILVKLGTHDIKGVEDLMFVLAESKPGQKVKATVEREGKKIELDVTFQESKGPR